MKVKELIKILKTVKQNSKIMVACDEEWNTIFKDIKVEENSDDNSYVIFGLSGSEIQED